MKEKIITKDKWIWMPHAGHLCVGHLCRFKLNTCVGKYIISTVGEYYPRDEGKMDTLGASIDSFYETMVFRARKSENKCCPYEISGDELDCIRYSTSDNAYLGHLKECKKWAKK